MSIKIQNLTVSYNFHPAVHHLNATINQGQWIAIVGPNGAGKSTLLDTLAGIITDYEGSIEGINPNSVAYLPQQTKLDKDFPITVFELISTGLWQEIGFSGGHEIITVWSFENNGPEGTTPGQLECHESFVSMLSFAPHGNRLASGARDGSIAIWGLMSDGHGGFIGTSQMSDHVSSIAWKKDSKVIAAGNAKGQIVTWKVKT